LIAALLAGCPDHPLDRAIALEAAGDARGAGNLYLEVAKADPANLGAWDKAIELICRRLGDVGECTNILDLELKALGKLDRHREVLSEVLEARASERIAAGFIREALADLERAKSANPDRAPAYVLEAKALLALGQRNAAVQAIQKARDLDPHNAEANRLVEELFPRTEDEEPFGGGAITGSTARTPGRPGSAPPRR
jgi:tetratricopeptide (TPR) repeat protein